MQQKNRLISIFMLSLLFVIMNNKTLNNSSNTIHIDRMITSFLKIEKKENENINIENNIEKFFLKNTRIIRKNNIISFWNIFFTYNKIYGRNNLKYIE
ncbi:hypothetical protein [Streptobacillus notomytis]|uniref:hypothetical protein n=1 Tax=Streptobacillus notomytis TaxID=1712031 RepID=UPI00083098D3|nr:hypothetical protein [Streptobacillus notomytis]